MKAIDHYLTHQAGEKANATHDAQDISEMKRCAERIWNAISKYVTIEEDAIFKDPDWPHLWDKK